MLATISCSLYRVVQWTRKLGHKKPEEKPPKRNKTHDFTYKMYVEVSFCFVPFRFNAFVRWFRFGFSRKPKTRRLEGRPLFFFSRPRPNVSRLRRPGRAQPSVTRACAAATSILNSLEETDRAVIESISIGFPSTYRFVYI